MHATLLRRGAALLTSFALAAGLLTLTAAPAQAARYGVTIAIADTAAVVGDTITITGKVSPKPSSRWVYLQRRFVGALGWKTIKKAHTTRSGAFRIDVGTGDERDRYYRVYKPKKGSRKAGYSAAIQAIVDPVLAPGAVRATLVGLTPTSGPLAGGTELTLTGTGFDASTTVTFTPLVTAAQTADGSGIMPELPGRVTFVDSGTLTVLTPASLGGANLVKVYAPSTTLTTTYTYAMSSREPDAFEQAVVEQINLRRASPQTCTVNGEPKKMGPVPPVVIDGALSDLALSHSRDLAARQDDYHGLSHSTYGTAEFSTRFALAGVTGWFGEILAISSLNSKPSDVVDQWMASGGHCESVMNGNWTKAGVGVLTGVWVRNDGTSFDSLFSNVDFQR